MKKTNKARSIAVMIMIAAIAAAALTGCGQAANETQEKASTPASSVSSEVKQDKESSVQEKSEVKTSVEETSKNESKTESSKDEASKAESSKDEPSKAETSKEESSKVESSVAEQSETESPVEPSEIESSAEESSVDESSQIVSIEDAIRYGEVTYPMKVTRSRGVRTMMAPGDYIAILREDADSYIFFIRGDYASIPKENVELFPENYTPNFNEGNWFTTIEYAR